MKKLDEYLTIIVNSCDAYEDLWYPFFKLYDIYAGKLKECNIVLNTETKSYSYPGLNIISYGMEEYNNIPWGARLRKHLKNIITPYVLLLMDDFFLRDRIRECDYKRIVNCVEWMMSNPEIGAMNLLPLDGVTEESQYEGFCEIKPGTPYRLNAQACIWRKEVLYDSILDSESPWIWEIYGNYRNDILLSSRIFSLKWGEREPYNYGFYDYRHKDEFGRVVAQSGVMRGKWDLSVVDDLFKANSIEIDYSRRGVYKKSLKKRIKENTVLRWLIYKPYAFLGLSHIQKKNLEDENHRKLIAEYVTPYIGHE